MSRKTHATHTLKVKVGAIPRTLLNKAFRFSKAGMALSNIDFELEVVSVLTSGKPSQDWGFVCYFSQLLIRFDPKHRELIESLNLGTPFPYNSEHDSLESVLIEDKELFSNTDDAEFDRRAYQYLDNSLATLIEHGIFSKLKVNSSHINKSDSSLTANRIIAGSDDPKVFWQRCYSIMF